MDVFRIPVGINKEKNSPTTKNQYHHTFKEREKEQIPSIEQATITKK